MGLEIRCKLHLDVWTKYIVATKAGIMVHYSNARSLG